MENKQFLAIIFFINVVDGHELINGNCMIPKRFCQANSRHSISILLAGDVDMNPRASVVAVVTSKRETFRAKPSNEWCVKLTKRVVADEKRFSFALTDV